MPPRVFVATIGDRVVAAFMAVQRSEAREVCREQWFLDDLRGQKDQTGRPFSDGAAQLTLRNAEPNEIAAHMAALEEAVQKGKCEGEESFRFGSGT